MHGHPMSALEARPRIVVAFGASGRATSATGPVTSLTEMMKALEPGFAFTVLAKPTLGLPHTVGVPAGLAALRRFLCAAQHDLVYMNSLFDREYTLPILMLRRFRLVPAHPAIIAPRGELLAPALGLKAGRKRIFLGLARTLGLIHDVFIHSTNPEELSQARAALPRAKGHLLAEEVRSLIEPRPHVDEPGLTRLAFVGRISAVKNLEFAVRALASVKSRVRYELYGPLQDAEYWTQCERLIAALPPNVEVHHHGSVSSDALLRVLSRTDMLFLPSRSENFGHAIFEALSCGVPVLIGDQTPWQDLADASAGWDLPLDDTARFAAVIDQFAGLDERSRMHLRAGARARAENYLHSSAAVEQNRAMFRQALAASTTHDH
jgi:glycosyltransferase involved in cell wall biosynthesis